MPNYVKTILTFNGSEKDIQKIKELTHNVVKDYKGEDVELNFDFSKIVPYPTREECPEKYFIKESELEMDSFSNKKVYCKRCSVNVLEEYPYLDWYTWNIDNWGTKWNACEPCEWDTNTIFFDTAWSFCEPVLIALSKKFPNVEIEFEYADEDIGCNCDSGYVLNGNLVRTNCKGEDPTLFAAKVWGCEDDYVLRHGKWVYKENADEEDDDLIGRIIDTFEDELEARRTGILITNDSKSAVIPLHCEDDDSNGVFYGGDFYDNVAEKLRNLIEEIRGETK